MSLSVRREGSGPALFRVSRPAPRREGGAARAVLVTIALLIALVVALPALI